MIQDTFTTWTVKLYGAYRAGLANTVSGAKESVEIVITFETMVLPLLSSSVPHLTIRRQLR